MKGFTVMPIPRKENFTLIPVSEVTTPRNGQVVMTDRWWIIVVENGVKHVLGYRGQGFKSLAPQCHAMRASLALREDPYPAPYGTFSIEFLPVAYWERGCFDVE
ncbi:MAG: hypothetical protein M1492_08705 [Gammaproteobacteria bacterium]|jgi:hypothetical protein|uniref:hypothetical protein n=1 Tax=Acidithiobacillus ferrooxidans TaxID=920 RepID=UPI00214877A1|nr:hypothetical protein [Acidithiobacillus ferrooxidans]MCL4526531.1 hypothetical protein [Gammaproteobacteria bacterium]MCR1347073.1 hypothetical protein [Acidithiobacillus ferrooxidans]MCR1355863.1 hypothetical protein [Acidithiobacillus ferrooxidans]MDA8376728.1 hypothetical protein [Planctomycetia bacterium]